MVYDAEWELYIGCLISKILENKNINIAVELAPGMKIKGAVALSKINFNGTLFVIDDDKDVCKFIKEEYSKILPNIKLIILDEKLETAINKLPINIDLFLANHVVDDLIIAEYSKNYTQDRLILNKYWDELANSNELFFIKQRILYQFFNLFKSTNIKYVLMSQYESNVFMKNKNANLISDEVFNYIKLLLNLEDLSVLENYYPFGDDERYLLPDLLSNVQNKENWIFGNKKDNLQNIYNILKEPLYNDLFLKTKDEILLNKAGFINYNDIINLDYNIFTTPLNKIKINKNTKNPVVLLSTGGFNPIHNGHLKMMEKAKKCLEENNYTVIGGFFSPSHEDYIKTKVNYIDNQADRLNYNYNILKDYNYLNIDTWEMYCNDRYINFSSVIFRLEKYLQKYVRRDVKVAYVFGDDNIEFSYLFTENIGICIYRNNPKFDYFKQNNTSNNMFFIKEDSVDISSKFLREIPIKTANNDIYIVRNEGILPFEDFKGDVYNAQRFFKERFLQILEKYIQNPIKMVNVSDEINKANNHLKGKTTISIDPYFIGTYNLHISRQFFICDFQEKPEKIIDSPGYINDFTNLPDENFALVDDDSVSGNTIKLLKQYINITDTYFLNSIIEDKIFDCIDLRDFMFGVKNSGLVVNILNQDIRVPYIYPYVNLYTRANIKDAVNFSKEIVNLNFEMYNIFFKTLKLKDVDRSFCVLMKLQGFDENELMINTIDLFRKIIL